MKCDQYWPTRGTETYGLIQVTLLDTVELATYCVRTFALFKVGGASAPRHAAASEADRSSLLPPPERLQREEGGEAVPVHGLAGPRGARAPNPVPGLPKTGEGLQPSGRRAHGGALQVGATDTASGVKWIFSLFAVMNI